MGFVKGELGSGPEKRPQGPIISDLSVVNNTIMIIPNFKIAINKSRVFFLSNLLPEATGRTYSSRILPSHSTSGR